MSVVSTLTVSMWLVLTSVSALQAMSTLGMYVKVYMLLSLLDYVSVWPLHHAKHSFLFRY